MLRKIFIVFLFNLIFIDYSYSSKNGMGELKITEEMMDAIITYYFKTENKSDRPGGLAITKDGDMIGFAVCPARYAGDCIFRDLEPLKYCRENVKKYLGLKENCWMLAKKRKIVWNNMNIEVSKGLSENEIREIFKRAGFYGKNESSPNSEKNLQSEDITKNLMDLKKLLDEGVITNKEFEDAKEKILN